MLKHKRLFSAVPIMALFICVSMLSLNPYKSYVNESSSPGDIKDFKAIAAFYKKAPPEIGIPALKAEPVPEVQAVPGTLQRDSVAEDTALADRGKTAREVKDYSHKIAAENVNLRDNPNTSSKVLTRLNINDKINIISRSGDWSRVKTSKGSTGWVKSEFIAAKNEVVAKKEKKQQLSVGQQAVNTAKKYLGVKYVWGGTSPKGFDCSGLVKYVYSKHGVKINRVAADQARQGTKVTRDKLKPGDLVFFDTDGGKKYINHVGMYIGGGKFIHASSGRSTGHRVVISSLSEKFYSKSYVTARRFFK